MSDEPLVTSVAELAEETQFYIVGPDFLPISTGPDGSLDWRGWRPQWAESDWGRFPKTNLSRGAFAVCAESNRFRALSNSVANAYHIIDSRNRSDASDLTHCMILHALSYYPNRDRTTGFPDQNQPGSTNPDTANSSRASEQTAGDNAPTPTNTGANPSPIPSSDRAASKWQPPTGPSPRVLTGTRELIEEKNRERAELAKKMYPDLDPDRVVPVEYPPSEL